ncbi:MAG: GAF domain-containing protein [Chloroflexi bacterium]|nr:GAF domain-containing protein [Chloroflexota bacterium]
MTAHTGSPPPPSPGDPLSDPGSHTARSLGSPDVQGQLRPALEEAIRLLGGDGGIVSLHDPDSGQPTIAAAVGLPSGAVGLASDAPATLTPDSLTALPDVRSVILAPLADGATVLGTLVAVSRRPDAFDGTHERLAHALAGHIAASLRAADLVHQLAASRRELSRRIGVEQALREIAARLTVTHDPAEVLQRAVDSAATLLGADGARIDLLHEGDDTLHWGYDATTGRNPGLGPIEGDGEAEPGEGISGRAVAIGGPVWTGDYLADLRFHHARQPDEFAARHGIRSALAVPIQAEHGSLGTLTVYTGEVDAYGPREAELLMILAHQASVAITNARLIEQLDRSRAELGRQAAMERALREITAEINAVRDPEEVLHRIAAEGAGLLDTDRVFINILEDEPDGPSWIWYSPTERGRDPWPRDEAIGFDEGMTGKAIAERRPVITGDYLNDTRFVHRPGPDRYTAALDLPSAIVVPIFDGDQPLGALLAESTVPDAFTEADAARLEVLARQAGIALSNARLLERLRRSEQQLRESEARYRYLVTASPDIVWEVDREGRPTFLSDVIERLTGFHPSELIGRSMEELLAPESRPHARQQFEDVMAHPERVVVARLALRRRDGTSVPVENFATGMFRDGELVGGHGAARDLSDRSRLERELRRQAAEIAASSERAHLARELHDSVTQALFAMTLVTRSIEVLLPRDRDAAIAKFDELRQLQREALAEMRSLLFELRPASLERDGLVQALRTHGAALESRVGLSVLVEAELPDRLPLDVEEALYRVAQEALHNVVKHARATQVRVRLERRGRAACLSVEDDGQGFDERGVTEAQLGLAGMRARAGRLGGTVSIRSRPGAGTTVEALVPMAVSTAAGTGGTTDR